MLAEFQQSVEEGKARGEFKDTQFHFISKTLEDYEHTYGKVDLILMVQSLYCILTLVRKKKERAREQDKNRKKYEYGIYWENARYIHFTILNPF